MSTRQLLHLGGSVDFVANLLMAGGLLGIVLGGIQWGIALISLGLFGPYLMRETGVLPWQDEFQREVIMRSGMHALLAVGLLVTAIMVVEGVGGRTDVDGRWAMKDAMTASTALLVLAVTWILSRTLQYWGTLVGARRFLMGYFGIGLLAMVVVFLGAMGREQGLSLGNWLLGFAQIGWVGLLVLGINRWPRLVGWLLLGTVASAVPHFITIAGQNMGEPAWIGVVEGACMMGLPLLVPGFALIAHRKTKEHR